jgi:hypothetical protein
MAIPASAATLAYDNGAPVLSNFPSPAYAVSGTVDDQVAWLSDTFTLQGTGLLSSAEVALWFPTGASVTSLDYCISGTAACTAAIESGSAVSIDPISIIGSVDGYTLEDFGFFLADRLYSSGTYWLQLSNVSVSAGAVGWDVDNGTGCTGNDGSGTGCPSGAVYSLGETQLAAQGTFANNNSESFQIFSTPEPGSMISMGSGLLVLAIVRSVRAGRRNC